MKIYTYIAYKRKREMENRSRGGGRVSRVHIEGAAVADAVSLSVRSRRGSFRSSQTASATAQSDGSALSVGRREDHNMPVHNKTCRKKGPRRIATRPRGANDECARYCRAFLPTFSVSW